ncbi:hypothetical protein VTK56DRAFT_5332 [Thermocarpiscus australiensis]
MIACSDGFVDFVRFARRLRTPPAKACSIATWMGRPARLVKTLWPCPALEEPVQQRAIIRRRKPMTDTSTLGVDGVNIGAISNKEFGKGGLPVLTAGINIAEPEKLADKAVLSNTNTSLQCSVSLPAEI